jgi:hypothetical protein
MLTVHRFYQNHTPGAFSYARTQDDREGSVPRRRCMTPTSPELLHAARDLEKVTQNAMLG